MNDRASSALPRFEVRVTAESHFAWCRTRLSLDRTLMAWVRTAAALIGFGFTIVQFFERFAHMSDVRAAARPDLPRYLGLTLIAAGTMGLVIALWQYRTAVHYFDGPPFAPISWQRDGVTKTPLLALAGTLVLMGVFAFVSVLIRLG